MLCKQGAPVVNHRGKLAGVIIGAVRRGHSAVDALAVRPDIRASDVASHVCAEAGESSKRGARQVVAHKVGNKLKILKRMLPTVASGPDKMQMKIYRSHAEVKMKVDTRKEDDHGDDIEHQTRGKSSSVLYMETVGTALSAQVHSNGARDNSIDVDESIIQDL